MPSCRGLAPADSNAWTPGGVVTGTTAPPLFLASSQVVSRSDSSSCDGESTHSHRKGFPRPIDDEGPRSYRTGRGRVRHAGGKTRGGRQTRLRSGNNRLCNGGAWVHIECFLSAAQSSEYRMPRAGHSSLINELSLSNELGQDDANDPEANDPNVYHSGSREKIAGLGEQTSLSKKGGPLFEPSHVPSGSRHPACLLKAPSVYLVAVAADNMPITMNHVADRTVPFSAARRFD